MKALKTKYPGVYQIGEKYYIDFYGNGKRHRKVIGHDLDKAQEEKLKLKKKNKQGKYQIIERMEETTFKELMELYKKEGDKKAYILLFEKVYLDYFGEKKLSHIGRSDLFSFRDKVKGTPKQTGKRVVTDSTVNRALAGLRRLFHFAIAKEYMEESPFPKDPKSGLFYSEKANRGKRKFFSKDEIMKIIEALPEDPWYLRPMTVVGYLSGMRAGEIMSIKWSNINFANGEILLEDTKPGEPQVVKIQDEIVELLKTLPHKSEFVFCQNDGKPLNHWHYYKAFKKALRVIHKSEKKWNFHTLRHTTGTQLHLEGVSPIAIKDQLRHSDIRVTTGYYVGCDSEYQKTQIEKLSSGGFKEFLKRLVADSETPVKKETDFEALQEVPPIATA